MHVVYICSPDRGDQLFFSLRSLLASGTSLERVTIYCVGPVPDGWRFGDPRIEVEEVPDLGEGFWMANKVHLCRAEGRRVVFLDTDTIILKPLDGLVEGREADVGGRESTYVHWRTWNPVSWDRLLRDHGAKVAFPYLSTGVIVFRHGIPGSLDRTWMEITRKLRKTRLPDLDTRVRANQLAFSIACGVEGLSHDLLTPAEHAYGWCREPAESATVFHAGTIRFFGTARRLTARTGCMDPALPVPLPSLVWPHWRENLRYPLSRIGGRLRMVLRRNGRTPAV
jgi:hypothetical protein